MIKGSEDEETGYGIGTIQHGDIDTLVVVDVEEQIVIMGPKDISFEDFIK